MLFRWKLYDLLCIGEGKLCIAEVLLINLNPQELSPYANFQNRRLQGYKIAAIAGSKGLKGNY